MPTKSFFTQGIAVLFNSTVKQDEVAGLLTDCKITKRVEQDEGVMSGPTLVLEFAPEKGGAALVDFRNDEWPDEMGEGEEESDEFVAWSMGHFGPFAYPGGLARAVDYAWNWERAADFLAKQAAYVRVRVTYVGDGAPDAPVLPKDYDPRAELDFLNEVALQLLEHPAAICYFNPNGEVLMTAEQLKGSMDFHAAEELPPLEAWCNIRLYNIDEKWTLMDCVGNEQLDVPDFEVGFPRHDFSPDDVAAFMRNATMHLHVHGDQIADGDTSNGPGNIAWEGYHTKDPLSDPPRSVIRWLPTGVEDMPELLFDGLPKR